MTTSPQECPLCNGTAFQWKGVPKQYAHVAASDIIHKGKPKPGDYLTCQECGYRFGKTILEAKP